MADAERAGGDSSREADGGLGPVMPGEAVWALEGGGGGRIGLAASGAAFYYAYQHQMQQVDQVPPY